MNRLVYLLVTLLGAVLLIFGPIQAVEASYQGFWVSYGYCLCSLLAGWLLWYGFSGLSFRRPSAAALRWVPLLALPMAAGLPSLSHSYHQSTERKAWALVLPSRDAELWQNRYVARVPESFRRAGWRSEYALAVCSYSVAKDDTLTLPWYADQAFYQHPEWYDDRVRKRLAQTYAHFFRERSEKLPSGWRAVLGYVAEKPSRGFYWRSPPPTGLERELRERYRGLLVFREPAQARPDDLGWAVKGESSVVSGSRRSFPAFPTGQLGR